MLKIKNGYKVKLQTPEIMNLLSSTNRLIDKINHDCNWTRTHNHLVRKRTLNHLAKLTSEHTVYCTSLIKILESKGSNISP